MPKGDIRTCLFDDLVGAGDKLPHLSKAISKGIFTQPRRPATICSRMTDRKPDFAEYYRQGAACLALAQLTDIASIKVRWLRMARTWFTLAEKTIEPTIPLPSTKTNTPNVVPLRPIRGGALPDG